MTQYEMLITLGIAIMAYLLGYAHATLKKQRPELTPKSFLKGGLGKVSTGLTRPQKIKVIDKRRPEPEEEKRNPNK